jgi:uncharacterized protein YukE
MSYKGADVQALRDLANAMISSKHDVEAALSRTRNELAHLNWQGPDRDRFVSEWGQHEGFLRQLCQGLEHAAQDAVAHAAAQERVSGGGGW